MMDTPSSENYRNIPAFITLDTELHWIARYLFTMIAFEIDLETNTAEISVEELAEKSDLSPAQIWRHLPALEAKGHIEIERRGKNKKDRHLFHIAGPAAPIVLDQVGPSLM